ncbi:MAG: long-chain-fatty-acid--CoA ligase [Pseudomonadota bacterium]|nr:long-chain-fatty-acid--CoA ligase [Pseudomonadota bacterium]
MRLHDYLEFFARETPAHSCAEMGGMKLTYLEVDRLANRFANSLLAQGLNKGDRFTYISLNSIDMVIMYYGAAKVGVIPVPLNYRLAPREVLYIVNDSCSKLVFSQPEFSDGVDAVSGEFENVQALIHLSSGKDRKGWFRYDNWLVDDDSKPVTDIVDTDQLYQMYTSGTTGLPKGVMSNHYSVCENITSGILFAGMEVSRERSLIVAPMYHVAAAVTAMLVIARGGSLVMVDAFDPVNVVNKLEGEKITIVTLVPAMIQACLIHVPDLDSRDFSSLRRITYGASPIAKEVLVNAIDKFGCEFSQGFGMTELSCIATGLSAEDHIRAVESEPELLTSAGRAVLGTDVRIADENDQEVPYGTVGELQVRGPQVMTGYWNRPDATAETLKGGWMHTGDAARMDEHGYIYIQDRIKDMIVSGGENIYPAEVENALFQHPAVVDAAVIGIPSEQWGESVLAFLVVQGDEKPTTEDLIEFCRSHLAGYKLPRQVEFVDVLPRNASGKVLKNQLREPYWEGIERKVN